MVDIDLLVNKSEEILQVLSDTTAQEGLTILMNVYLLGLKAARPRASSVDAAILVADIVLQNWDSIPEVGNENT